MNAKQLGYTVEEYKGVFRFSHKEKGITIYVNINVGGKNTAVDIELPAEIRPYTIRLRVNDAEELAMLLVKVKLIADTLRGTTNV